MRTHLLHRLKPWLDLVAPERRLMAVQIVQFAVIGASGTVWYTATEYAATPYIGPYFGGILGFLIAVTSNWLLNRFWTFRHLPREPLHRQWLKFVAANLVGAAVNLGINFTLIATVPFCREYLIVPIMVGTLAGMAFNFSAAHKLVFR